MARQEIYTDISQMSWDFVPATQFATHSRETSQPKIYTGIHQVSWDFVPVTRFTTNEEVLLKTEGPRAESRPSANALAKSIELQTGKVDHRSTLPGSTFRERTLTTDNNMATSRPGFENKTVAVDKTQENSFLDMFSNLDHSSLSSAVEQLLETFDTAINKGKKKLGESDQQRQKGASKPSFAGKESRSGDIVPVPTFFTSSSSWPSSFSESDEIGGDMEEE